MGPDIPENLTCKRVCEPCPSPSDMVWLQLSARWGHSSFPAVVLSIKQRGIQSVVKAGR